MQRDLRILRALLGHFKELEADNKAKMSKFLIGCTREQLHYHILLLTKYKFITGGLTENGKQEIERLHHFDKIRIMTELENKPQQSWFKRLKTGLNFFATITIVLIGVNICYAGSTDPPGSPIVIEGPWDNPETSPPYEIED